MKVNMGFELEAYTDEYDDESYDFFDEIYADLTYKGLNIDWVKEDGSLCCGGFEINSGVYEGFKNFKKGFLETIQGVQEIGGYTESPAAIHVHFSNVRKPQNIYYLLHPFQKLIGVMFKNSGWDLIYDHTNPYVADLQTLLRSNNPKLVCRSEREYRDLIGNINYSECRGGVLRNRGEYSSPTIELRPIPTRFNPDYLNIWLKIIKNTLKESNKKTKKIEQQGIMIPTLKFKQQVNKFKKIFNLNNTELFILSHKMNNEKWELYDNIKDSGLKSDSYIKIRTNNELERLLNIKESQFDLRRFDTFIMDNSLRYGTEILQDKYDLPILDTDNPLHRTIHNIMTNTNGYDYTTCHFTFCRTNISEIWNYNVVNNPVFEGYPLIREGGNNMGYPVIN